MKHPVYACVPQEHLKKHGGRSEKRDSMTRRSPGPRRGGSAPRGGSRGGCGGGGGRAKEPEKSKEDLDAEMEAYMSTKAA